MLVRPFRVIVVAAVAAWLVVPAAPSTALAAGGGEKEAKALFQRAEKAFNLGKFPEALADYEGAYEAKALPAFLFNIAQCHRNMGNYEKARFHYRRYLSLEPRSANRALVEDLIAEMTRLLDKQAADQQATAAAATPPTTPAAAAPPAGDKTGAVVALAPPATAAPGVAGAGSGAQASLVTSPAPAAEGETASRPVYKRWWFWTAIGAAVAGGVVAGLLLTRSDGPQGSLPPIDGR